MTKKLDYREFGLKTKIYQAKKLSGYQKYIVSQIFIL